MHSFYFLAVIFATFELHLGVALVCFHQQESGRPCNDRTKCPTCNTTSPDFPCLLSRRKSGCTLSDIETPNPDNNEAAHLCACKSDFCNGAPIHLKPAAVILGVSLILAHILTYISS